MKKTIITLAAAAALSVAALAPSATPASASHVDFSVGFYGDGFALGIGSGHFGGHRHCKRVWRKIWTHYGPVWKKVRICHRHHHHF
jgi:hypothetical protein